jgi:protoheme IX farnesyltransferase
MPTLIGWAGASATLERQAWFLFAILFLWQFPHFLAIALLYREDYERAGFRMLPRFDLDGNFTRAEILGFTVVLIATTLALAPGTSYPWAYAIGVTLAGLFFLYYGAKLGLSRSKVSAGRLIHASVLYLPVVLVIMALCKR